MSIRDPERKIQKPMLNGNGTSYKELFKAYQDARIAILDARTALFGANPHQRDFRNRNWQKAVDEQMQRVHWLDTIEADLEGILMDLCDQKLA